MTLAGTHLPSYALPTWSNIKILGSNARLQFKDRLHPLEVDLRRRFHQQLHSGDPAPARDRRAASGGLRRGAMIALMLWLLSIRAPSPRLGSST